MPKDQVGIDPWEISLEECWTDSPLELEEIAESHGKLSPESIVVIDEIQKVPELLNEVHRLIEEKNLRLLLTGSSARKLKASEVNLLAGRAWIANLFPLTIEELGAKFDLERILLYGGLPQVYFSEAPVEEPTFLTQGVLKNCVTGGQ